MRRFLIAVATYPWNLARAAARGWDRFFFTPADPLPVGLIRLVVGGLLAWSLLVAGLDLRDWFGTDGWADPETLAILRGNTPSGPGGNLEWSLWSLVPDSLLRPVWVAGLVATLMFAVGLGSRTTAAIAWALAVSASRRTPVMIFGFDQIVSTWALYLAVTGSSGQSLSIDGWLARRFGRIAAGPPRPTVSANIALRLIQLHLCVIYGMAGLAKLQGRAWWDGTAFARLLGDAEFRPLDLTGLAAWPALIMLATHVAVGFELTYPVLVWNRWLRPLVLAMAVALHAGIGLTMGLYEFALAMIAGNLAFVSGPWLRRLATAEPVAEESAAVPASRPAMAGPRPTAAATGRRDPR